MRVQDTNLKGVRNERGAVTLCLGLKCFHGHRGCALSRGWVLGHLLSWLQSCCEEEAGKVGGEQAMEVQKALCLTVSQLEV